MGRFADACVAELDDRQLDDYERLIEVPDPELFAWVTGAAETPASYDTGVMRKLRAFHTRGSGTA